MTKIVSLLGYALFTASLLGCGSDLPENPLTASQCPDWAEPEEDGEPLNTEPPVKTTDVAACAGGASQPAIEANLAFAKTIEASLAHLIYCGRFTRSFSVGISHFFASLSCGQPAKPAAFQYAGTGSYHAGPQLSVQTKLIKDTPFGKAGDDIPFDLFDTTNYFDSTVIRAALSLDLNWNTNGDYGAHLAGVIEFTPTKPKKEALALWGIEAVEGEPVSVRQEDLAKTIGESVAIVADADVQEYTDAGIVYRIATPEFSVGSMYQGQDVPLEVVDMVATNADTNQALALVDWDLAFIPITRGAATGAVIVRIDGGTFPYYVRYAYPNRGEPDVQVSCTAPAP